MVKSLVRYKFEVVPVGFREGNVSGLKILVGKPDVKDVHTVSLYIGPKRQPEYYDYILSLKPKRIIFNPGTINEEFIKIAKQNKIKAVTDCSLVMVSSGKY
jgi:hypothetical protein